MVVDHPPGNVECQVRIAIQQRDQYRDVLTCLDGDEFPRQTQVRPHDRVVRVVMQHRLDPGQVLGRHVIVAQIRVDRQRHAAFAQHSHERRPLRDGGQGDGPTCIVEQGLLDQVDLPHPLEQPRKLLVQQSHAVEH